MAEKKYRVTLTDEEKEQFKAIIDRGKHTGENGKRHRHYCLPARDTPMR
jgi:hypothetical protein